MDDSKDATIKNTRSFYEISLFVPKPTIFIP